MRLLAAATLAVLLAPGASRYFAVHIVDDVSGRGVPLVQITLPNEATYWTDSAGIAALDEPSLASLETSATIKSHGYQAAEAVLRIKPGASQTVRVHRTMIAERLYRLTGEGIYRDSLLADIPAPFEPAWRKGQVMGQDTVSAAIYKGRIYWIWGDTIGPHYWNFNVSGATSTLHPDPAKGIAYDYFVDAEGRSRAMLPLPRRGLVWIEGLLTIKDPQGTERLLATYTLQQGLKPPDECGVARFDDTKNVFEPWFTYPCRGHHVSAHPFLFEGYWYLYPSLRVPNDWAAIQDLSRWETREAQVPKRPSSVAWNEYRKRFVLFYENTGEVWYAESLRPEGPYSKGVRIVHHDDYNFYNVAHHPFFNQDGGRTVYFEGTYTDAFSAAKSKTPRYNYNQIMYRLNLDDPRLKDAQQ